jgi:cytidylate kinase
MQKKAFIFLPALSFILICVVFSGCSNSSKTLTVDELLNQTIELNGKDVVVEGIATHVCEKSGMKIFIKGSSDEQTIRAESNSTIGKFDPSAVNQMVRIIGKLVEDTTDDSSHHESENLSADSTVCETEQSNVITYHIAANAYQIIK